MRLLADTRILLWAAYQFRKLPAAATELLLDRNNVLFFSSASIWELAIKSSQGRSDFKVDATRLHRGLVTGGFHELPIAGSHTIVASALPPIHKDPFDRILIAQATVEAMLLLTRDLTVAKYQGPIRLV